MSKVRVKFCVALLHGDYLAFSAPQRARENRVFQHTVERVLYAARGAGERMFVTLPADAAVLVCVEMLARRTTNTSLSVMRSFAEERADAEVVLARLDALRPLAAIVHENADADEVRRCAEALMHDAELAAVWKVLTGSMGWQYAWRRTQMLKDRADWETIAGVAKCAPVRNESELLELVACVA